MIPESWQALYRSDVQSLYALLIVPAAFLLYRLATGPRSDDGPRSRFVDRYALVFAALSLLDPLCTGPLVRALGVGDGPLGTAVQFSFVLLGDFRVFALLFVLAAPHDALARSLRVAALTTLGVPAFAGAVFQALRLAHPGLPGQALWLVYEGAFLALSLWLARSWIPRNVATDPLARFLRGCAGYAAVYYALWAGADVLILAGADAGWALRVVPNQLYYAFWVPFVYFRYCGHFPESGSSADATAER